LEHLFVDIYGTIEKAAGKIAAKKLLRDLGGTRVYVASAPQPHSRIVNSVGMEAAIKISKVLVGSTAGFDIMLPKDEGRRKARLRALAFKLSERGHSTRAIARKLGVHERTAWRYLATYRNKEARK
jgi:hypothetical protein